MSLATVRRSGYALQQGDYQDSDDIRLVGKGKSISLGEFETGLDGWRGLTLFGEFTKTGRRSGKWHQMNVDTSLRLSELPADWTDVEADPHNYREWTYWSVQIDFTSS